MAVLSDLGRIFGPILKNVNTCIKCYIIYGMDFDEKKRRQLIRVIIAEVGMAVSVAAIVVIAVLAAMGFSISGNGGIEQTGLMQLRSLPTGASVKIDGNTIFYRTNLSRTLSAGDHEIELSRDGYDTWSKTVRINSGMLLRVFYPRLFLQNRVAEAVQILSNEQEELELYSPSRSRNYILYAGHDSPRWQLVDVRGDDPKTVQLDLTKILPGVVRENVAPARSTEKKLNVANTVNNGYRFDGRVDEVRWSSNDDAVLVKVTYQERAEWILINLHDLNKSVNISKAFGIGGVQLGIIDGSANQLFILENQQLRRINVADGVMSRVLLDNVKFFANQGANLIYIAEDRQSGQDVVGVYRDDEKGGTVITQVPEKVQAKVALASYYGEDYIAYVFDNKMTILYGRIPSYVEEGANLNDLKTLVDGKELTRVPNQLTVSPDGEYIVAKYDRLAMVTDLEMGEVFEYDLPTNELRWFDASMLYAVVDEELVVWDFDGTNKRNLAASMTPIKENLGLSNYNVMVTANNRWVYYVVNDGGLATLVREKIRD